MEKKIENLQSTATAIQKQFREEKALFTSSMGLRLLRLCIESKDAKTNWRKAVEEATASANMSTTAAARKPIAKEVEMRKSKSGREAKDSRAVAMGGTACTW